MGESYASAGIRLEANDEVVERLGAHVASTRRPEVLGGLGGFGGLFAAGGFAKAMADPVLVSSTDGVGTKLRVASAVGRYDTVGLDLVAMCVDDLVCTGAEPLFLLDCVTLGADDPALVEALVSGIADGCRQAGCALLGGETAIHPGGELDLTGFAVGVVDRDLLITGERIKPGDAVIGLLSPGLRSNGYSLARRVVDLAGLDLAEPAYAGSTRTVGDELLEPSVIYAPAVMAAVAAVDVLGVAHVTGGGLPGNLPRMLPDGVDVHLDRSCWEAPPVFGLIQSLGSVADDEMARVFNLGIGMVLVVRPDEVATCLSAIAPTGRRAAVIGEISAGAGAVHL